MILRDCSYCGVEMERKNELRRYVCKGCSYKLANNRKNHGKTFNTNYSQEEKSHH